MSDRAREWKYPEDVEWAAPEVEIYPTQVLAIAANPGDEEFPWAIILADRKTMFDVNSLSFSGEARAVTDWTADNYWYPKMWIEICGYLQLRGTSATISAAPSLDTAQDETGWLMENGEVISKYIGVIDGALRWTDDNLKALRLARRADAEALCEIVDDCWQIVEHMWCGPRLLDKTSGLADAGRIGELEQAVKSLLEWVPKCSVGSSGYQRVERVKVALPLALAELERRERMIRVCENAFKLQDAFTVEGRGGELNGLQIAKAWLALEMRAEKAEKETERLRGERDALQKQLVDMESAFFKEMEQIERNNKA